MQATACFASNKLEYYYSDRLGQVDILLPLHAGFAHERVLILNDRAFDRLFGQPVVAL